MMKDTNKTLFIIDAFDKTIIANVWYKNHYVTYIHLGWYNVSEIRIIFRIQTKIMKQVLCKHSISEKVLISYNISLYIEKYITHSIYILFHFEYNNILNDGSMQQ